MFEIHLSTRSKNFLKNADKETYNRIIKRIKELSIDIFPSDAKRVIGRKEKVFRIRVGNYRILYVVYFEDKNILISDIDKRSKIYKK